MLRSSIGVYAVRREKRSAFLRCVLLAACVFALCIGSVPAGAQQQVSLNFGILPVVDTLPLIVAKEKGFFEAEGIDLKLVSFQSALERDVAFQSNKVNGYFGDLLNTLLLVNAGERLNIITTVFRTNREHRMFALLASPKSGITGIEKVEGETIAISKSSVIEFVLDEILAGRKIRPEKITKLEIRAIPIRYQMLMGNQVKLALLPEPLVTKAVAEGALVLADDRQLDVTLTVLALKLEAVQRRRTFPRVCSGPTARPCSSSMAIRRASKTCWWRRHSSPRRSKLSTRFPVPLAEPPPSRMSGGSRGGSPATGSSQNR